MTEAAIFAAGFIVGVVTGLLWGWKAYRQLQQRSEDEIDRLHTALKGCAAELQAEIGRRVTP